ncbi:hypothetical protein L21SP3_02326 [Sedimentisphaera cyanobacteriorum]|uniref:Uncharacterized protein n=1 Tax=Sedimentisphaera cyanobacteriorum TaxID=1940790 RepID=A0A1Q2HSZ3_9BACT|nr:hypothetical protein [Sedimentisphaera cyanobacteriorum]AQQ10491.1 hypothetical protein L21SP3_02326 [Sedimentisphaera cyanobacteriorum]
MKSGKANKWAIAFAGLAVIACLYIIELSKIEVGGSQRVPGLDNVKASDADKQWAPFYRVRASLIDNQTAEFDIPEKLRRKDGEQITLTGAAMFYGSGCSASGDKVSVEYFFLVPSLSIADACTILPEVMMRYRVRVNLAEPWVLSRVEMTAAIVRLSGRFRIDTSKPFEAAFIVDEAECSLAEND